MNDTWQLEVPCLHYDFTCVAVLAGPPPVMGISSRPISREYQGSPCAINSIFETRVYTSIIEIGETTAKERARLLDMAVNANAGLNKPLDRSKSTFVWGKANLSL